MRKRAFFMKVQRCECDLSSWNWISKQDKQDAMTSQGAAGGFLLPLQLLCGCSLQLHTEWTVTRAVSIFSCNSLKADTRIGSFSRGSLSSFFCSLLAMLWLQFSFFSERVPFFFWSACFYTYSCQWFHTNSLINSQQLRAKIRCTVQAEAGRWRTVS